MWVRRRWQSQRSVRALDTCNYAQVKWTLARSLFFFFSLFHLSFSFLLFMAKFYPAYISFCASARRERVRAREKRVLRFLGLQFISCPGVNKKGRKSRTFISFFWVVVSFVPNQEWRESQPSALARRRSSDSVNIATNKMRRTRNQPTVDVLGPFGLLSCGAGVSTVSAITPLLRS